MTQAIGEYLRSSEAADGSPTIADYKTRFIGELINEDKVILGNEVLAWLSIKGHYPEKDGIPACLLAAEAVAARGARLSEQPAAPDSHMGRLESGRISLCLTPDLVASLPEKLRREPAEIGGCQVERLNHMDGVKFIFADGSWLLMREVGHRASCAHLF